MGDDGSEGGTTETVSELSETDDPQRSRPNPLDSLSAAERRRAFDGFEPEIPTPPPGQSGKRHVYERRLAIWTVSTVALALVSSILLGFLSITAGQPMIAFGAGILSGGSGLALGFALVNESRS